MGMFDKDKEIGAQLTQMFPARQLFILWNAKIAPEKVDTKLGPARKTVLTVSTMQIPGKTFDVGTLASAIADKVEEASADDFPAVVYWHTVDGRFGNPATVLSYVEPWKGGGATSQTKDDEDIPF